MQESEDYYFKEHINPNYTNYSKELKIKETTPGLSHFMTMQHPFQNQS